MKTVARPHTSPCAWLMNKQLRAQPTEVDLVLYSTCLDGRLRLSTSVHTSATLSKQGQVSGFHQTKPHHQRRGVTRAAKMHRSKICVVATSDGCNYAPLMSSTPRQTLRARE